MSLGNPTRVSTTSQCFSLISSKSLPIRLSFLHASQSRHHVSHTLHSHPSPHHPHPATPLARYSVSHHKSPVSPSSFSRKLCIDVAGSLAPGHCTASAPAAQPISRHACSPCPRMYVARNAPQKASPAPTVSATWTLSAPQRSALSPLTATAPRLPSVNTATLQC